MHNNLTVQEAAEAALFTMTKNGVGEGMLVSRISIEKPTSDLSER